MADIKKLGKFEVRRELGKGAMGVVYEGFDPMIERTVAIKTIRAETLEGEGAGEQLARFRREAQAAGRLTHPNIVSIYDFGQDGDTYFIAMEFVKGRELLQILNAGERFTLPAIVKLMTQLLEALDYSHRAGVVHRDIKPANIILLDDGTVKVADFGIARVESSNLTQTGVVLGTPSYMSPEQFVGLTVDGRTDIFSAGIILYQLLTGERPFTGSITTIMHKVMQEHPLPPSTLNLQVPRSFDDVIHKALAKRPDERYQTGREFAEAIRAAAETARPGAAAGGDVEATQRLADTPAASHDPTLAVGDAGAPTASPTTAQTAAQTAVQTAAQTAAPTAARTAAAAPAATPTVAQTAVPAVAPPTVAQATPTAVPPPHGTQASANAATAAAPRAATPAPMPSSAADEPTVKIPTTPPPVAAPPKRAPLPMPAVLGGAAVLVVAAGGWLMFGNRAPTPPVETPVATAPAPQATPASEPGPASPSPTAAVEPVAPPPAAPGTVVVTALGLADPTDPRYKDDRGALEAALRADSRSQLVEKTLGMYVQQASLTQHYDRLRDTLLAKSGDFIESVTHESAPRLGKDGLMVLTTQAVVKSKELQKSLNEMSRHERIDFIRNHGDPKISVRVAMRDADRPDGEAQPSPIAENMLKQRIKSFGFRTWSEEAGSATPDFIVSTEVRVKKLSAKLPASGLTITKFTLTSWTVKCTDRESGEEIYFNTALPKGVGSWASEEDALQAIGGKLADEFSRDFFLQHLGGSAQRVTLRFDGVADPRATELLGRELISLGSVLSSTARPGAVPPTFDLQLSGTGSAQDLVGRGILQALNAKLGRACFRLGASGGGEVSVSRDAACSEADIVQQLEAAPPAGLYEAPPSRQRSVVKDPQTLKKLTT